MRWADPNKRREGPQGRGVKPFAAAPSQRSDRKLEMGEWRSAKAKSKISAGAACHGEAKKDQSKMSRTWPRLYKVERPPIKMAFATASLVQTVSRISC
jgi:hypothetical protein